ncbi:TSCPD domain-containing protein [Spirochaetia bacterium]|nr:TSCPD domain-containing protein [Spirochaetia bacterium]
MHEYKTEGTCSTKIRFDIRENKVRGLSFENGCNGNLKALSILAEGMERDELIAKLKGLQCGIRGTSCADQFARALELYKGNGG